jgi:hypothetical protein
VWRRQVADILLTGPLHTNSIGGPVFAKIAALIEKRQ